MTKADIDHSAVSPKSDGEPGQTRREVALTLFGALGAGALLKGCAAPTGTLEQTEPYDPEPGEVGVTASALQSSGTIRWFDYYAELRTWSGGTSTSSNNVAFGRNVRTGGLFGWSTDTTTADNNATVIVPNASPRTGCWKRVYSGAIDVRWFGAVGDGVTNDTTAIQNAVNYATGTGADLFFAAGYYRVTATINIGLPIFTNYEFIVNRTSALNDANFAQNMISANFAANQALRPISLTFDTNAFLVADFTPSVVTPVIAYNLDHDRSTGAVRNIQVIGTAAMSGGRYQWPPSTPATNKIIGLFAFRGCSVTDKAMFAALQYGMVTAGSFWTTIRDLTAQSCGDALNIAMGNAITVSNVTVWYCNRGIVFCGSGSKIMMINTEQANYDLVILSADCCTFGPGYFEDGRSQGVSTYSYITSGVTPLSYDVVHSIFDGIRIGGTAGGKRGMILRGTKDVTFINVRTYAAVVDASPSSNDSYGTLINCDFDLAGPSWTAINSISRFGGTLSPGSQLALYSTLAYQISPNFGTIAPQSIATFDVTIPAITVPTNYLVHIQASSAVNDLVQVTARIISSTVVRLSASNPTSAPIAHGFFGTMCLQIVS